MKRGRGAAVAAFVLAGCIMLSGCGKENVQKIAFVGNLDAGIMQEINRETWEGISDYSEEKGIAAKAYTPDELNVTGARKSMSEAIRDGADVIVCAGEQMENAVYDLQQIETHTEFLLLDGVPSDGSDENKVRIRGNTYCVIFNREEAGFLAGYAAVMEGYTYIGYLGGSRNSEDVRYGAGVVEGADQAAQDKGLEEGSITIRYGFLSSNAINPDQISQMESWFDNGCQVLCVSGSGPEFIGQASAAEKGAKVIGSLEEDSDSADESTVIGSSGIHYGNAVQKALDMLVSGELKGGKENRFGISEDGVYLRRNESGFRNFTEEQYQAVVSKLKSGEIRLKGANAILKPERAGIQFVKLTEDESFSGQQK